MAHLIPDEVLKTLKCSICCKYLSVKPIKVYPDRKTKCGRCSEEDDNGVVSLYESIVENKLFRCVNRYEGCNYVYTCDDMRLHEVDCKGGQYTCCLCSHFTGTAYDYATHFEKQHKTQIIDKPIVTLTLSKDKENHYMYTKNDLLFIIFVKIDSKKDIIILHCVNVGPDRTAKKVKFKFEIYENEKLLHKTTERNCSNLLIQQDGFLLSNSILSLEDINAHVTCELKLNMTSCETFIYIPVNMDVENRKRIVNLQQRMKSIKIKNKTLVNKIKNNIPCEKVCTNLCLCHEYQDSSSFKISFDEATQIKYPKFNISNCGAAIITNTNTKFDLFCSNCEKFCSHYWNIFECEKCNNFTCNQCKTFVNMEYCSSGHKLKPNLAITDIYNKLKITCKWNCGESYKSPDIISHQRVCDRRPKQFCPVLNCQWRGYLRDLEKHFHDTHSKITLFFSNRVDDIVVNKKNNIVYLYNDRDVIVVVRKGKISDDVYKCNIMEVLPQLKLSFYNLLLQEFNNCQFVTNSFTFNKNKVFRLILKEKCFNER
ncbi:unnamed protein product [Brassicogethes aeneus]|uniref:RING-type E3 ubiquitin transferase n=1 Tax=Brassicogethes aeneus TaxID=1431903 RepID=A0A9P0AYW2_BRAAE|nr:unnamed protein product [Brassicogethes aeneus]